MSDKLNALRHRVKAAGDAAVQDPSPVNIIVFAGAVEAEATYHKRLLLRGANALEKLLAENQQKAAELARLRAEVERLRKVESRFADIYWRQEGVPKDHRLVLGLLDSGWVEIVYRDGGKWLLNEDAPPVNVQAWCPQPMTDEEWEAEQQALSAKPATGKEGA